MSFADMASWAYHFTKSVGFEPEKAQLSEVHVRCDVPTPFVTADAERMRGLSTRKGNFNTHMHLGALSGIDNLGGKKRIKFVIYDKRLEQRQKQAVLWPAVWRSYGIAPDSPIWRIEARWNRKTLLECGLDWLGDLNEKTIAGLWHLFSQRYLLFVKETDKRTARTEPLEKWARIQSCGKLMEVNPVETNVEVTSTQYIKQAVGCAAKAMAVAGRAQAQDEINRIIDTVVELAEERFDRDRRFYIGALLKEAVDNYPEEGFTNPESLKKDMKDLLDDAISGQVNAAPYS